VTLRIAKDLELPVDGVTQTLACIGRKGAGKTYLAGVLAEQMLDARAQVVVLDAVGTWWGLRVGADGKSKGKDIFVLGGEHGDVAITAEHGARIARFVVEKRVSAVVDVSSFRQGERKRFAADFGEELFQLQKKSRIALHLFVEEAQLFAPQRPGPDEARMLGAFELIVRLGRNYGIGCTLITQRPQSVNKEVLSQVECLCVLQLTGPHERKALEEWVQEAGADRKLVGQLPGLARGEGYVWSPAWLKRYERVHFAKKVTFDASATPEVGKAAKVAELAAVDVDALRSDLAEVVAEAEKDDPKALRRKVAELQRELAKKPAPAKEKRVEVPVLKDSQIERLDVDVERMAEVADKLTARLMDVRDALLRAKVTAPVPAIVPARPCGSRSASRAATPAREYAARTARHQVASGLQPARQKILDALAWAESVGLPSAEKTQLAFLFGRQPDELGLRQQPRRPPLDRAHRLPERRHGGADGGRAGGGERAGRAPHVGGVAAGRAVEAPAGAGAHRPGADRGAPARDRARRSRGQGRGVGHVQRLREQPRRPAVAGDHRLPRRPGRRPRRAVPGGTVSDPEEILCAGGERIRLLGPWIDGQGQNGHAILRVRDGEIHAGAMMSPSDMRALAALLTKAADDLDAGRRR
jgi:hypothetical protein